MFEKGSKRGEDGGGSEEKEGKRREEIANSVVASSARVGIRPPTLELPDKSGFDWKGH